MATRLDQAVDYCNLVTDPPQVPPRFSPPECWDPQIYYLREDRSEYVPQEWLPNTIEATPPLVGAPTRIAAKDELDVLVFYQEAFRATFAREITEQNELTYSFSAPIAAPLFDALSAHGTAFEGTLLSQLHRTTGDAGAIAVQQKLLFNRARPFQVDARIAPMFKPGHPSYPSGHSTQAHACAFLVAALVASASDPHDKVAHVGAKAIQIANAIAVNREIAGVHFPSDTQAGRILARRLVTQYLNDPRFLEDRFSPLLAELNKLLA